MNTYVPLWYYLDEFFLEWEMFQKSRRENQNTHFVFSNSFRKIVRFVR